MGLFNKKKSVESEEEKIKTGVVEVGRKKELTPPNPPKKREEEVLTEPSLSAEDQEKADLIEYFQKNYGVIPTGAGLDTTNSLLFGVFSEIVKLRLELLGMRELDEKEEADQPQG